MCFLYQKGGFFFVFNLLLSFLLFLTEMKIRPNQHFQYAENVSNFCMKLYFVLVFSNITIMWVVPLLVTFYFYATNDVMQPDMWILAIPS